MNTGSNFSKEGTGLLASRQETICFLYDRPENPYREAMVVKLPQISYNLPQECYAHQRTRHSS
jgi:hypothetical protein